MTNNRLLAALLVLLLLVAVHGDDEGICKLTKADLDACKPAVVGPEPAEPSEECCTALAGADLQCLCSYRHSFLLPALGIDPDLAMQLPQKCKLTPPQDCS